jgi:predicted alpha/beta hydrolase
VKREEPQSSTVAASDGFELSVTTFGDPRTATAGVLIAPAMGVEQQYYAAFAQWLAGQGYFAVTFDYRGIGRSRPSQYRQSLRGFQGDVFTWAQRDCAAMVAFMDARLADWRPQRPLLWVGHSLGGQILALVPNRERVAAMVTIAVGSGYWRENAGKLKTYVWWLWFVAAPLSLRLYGYFPGRRLRKIGDLPAGVMQQWRTWCLNREYVVGAEGDEVRAEYARVKTPILSLSFTDDEFMSLANTRSLHSFYSGAPREMKRIAPGEIGVRRIGHFGFFRSKFADTLWAQAAQWLAAHAARTKQAA